MALVRRHPWPVAAVAFAFVCVVLSAVIVTTRVGEERDEARRLSRVFGHIASWGIEPRPENEALLKAYTQATERYFSRLGADAIDSDRVDLALAWDRLARIHMRVANFPVARSEAERSIALSAPIVAAHPEDLAAQEAYVGALMTLGGVAQVEGKTEEMVALRTKTLETVDAVPLKDPPDAPWPEFQTLALVTWLYDVSESMPVPSARVEQAAALSRRAEQSSHVHPRTALMLNTWLAEERWRTGQLDEARRHLVQLDKTSKELLSSDPPPPTEVVGLVLYSLMMAGNISAWSNQPERAREFWERVERTAAPLVNSESAAGTAWLFERDRAWLFMGRVAEARAHLRRLVAAGLPVGSTERWATLLLGEPLAEAPRGPEDALDALTLALHAARGGHLHDAAGLLLDARKKGISRQLFSTPGMMARATAAMPAAITSAASDFARRWDDGMARGDVAALDQALEDFAAALESSRAR